MIDIALIHFKTLGLAHLDAALFTLAQQDMTDVRRITVYDNDSPDTRSSIEALVVQRLGVPRLRNASRLTVGVKSDKHGDPRRTQSWSVNWVLKDTASEWLFLTRSDFLLSPDCLAKFRAVRDSMPPDWRGFVTSWCHQMGCDDQLSNTDMLAPHSLPDAPWRAHPDGAGSLVGHVPACYFQSTDVDAGVWLARPADYLAIGGLNEHMVSWGFQQQEAQRGLARSGVQIVNLQEYLFHHQHHYAPRDFGVAGAETRFQRW
jgi:hypothetical protein